MINNLKKDTDYGYIGEAANDNFIVRIWSNCIEITDYKAIQVKPRVKRYLQNAYYTHTEDSQLTPIKEQVYNIVEKHYNVTFEQIDSFLYSHLANNWLNLEQRQLKKSELPYLRQVLRNSRLEVRIDEDGLTVSEFAQEGETFYLDCCKTEKKRLIRAFLGDYNFSEASTFREIVDFFKNLCGGRYPLHCFCNLD